jgi:hypothetical protein
VLHGVEERYLYPSQRPDGLLFSVVSAMRRIASRCGVGFCSTGFSLWAVLRRRESKPQLLNPVLLRGFRVGADLLPAARAFLGVENFFAQADGFRRDLDELVVGDEFDGLLEAQLAVGNQADGLVGA